MITTLWTTKCYGGTRFQFLAFLAHKHSLFIRVENSFKQIICTGLVGAGSWKSCMAIGIKLSSPLTKNRAIGAHCNTNKQGILTLAKWEFNSNKVVLKLELKLSACLWRRFGAATPFHAHYNILKCKNRICLPWWLGTSDIRVSRNCDDSSVHLFNSARFFHSL